jgi:hypothetical protein
MKWGVASMETGIAGASAPGLSRKGHSGHECSEAGFPDNFSF